LLVLTPPPADAPKLQVKALTNLGLTIRVPKDAEITPLGDSVMVSVPSQVDMDTLMRDPSKKDAYVLSIDKPEKGKDQIATWRAMSVQEENHERGPARLIGENVDANGWALAYEVHNQKGGTAVKGAVWSKKLGLVCSLSGDADDPVSVEVAKRALATCLTLTKQ
jgi:hypothetical protein